MSVDVVGSETSNFTSSSALFMAYPHVTEWRFEVVYGFETELSASALDFMINDPPRNGSCSIWPVNGSTTTVFTVSCVNWYDEDEIKDYALYSKIRLERSMTKAMVCSCFSLVE